MAIRLVAIDLDDTLLCDDFTISKRTLAAVRMARESGVKITLATGRMPGSARPYAEQLGLDVPVINYHGAMIQNALSREVLYRRVIPVNLAVEIVEFLHKQELYVQVYLGDRVFTRELNQCSDIYKRIASVRIEQRDLLQLLKEEPEGVEKMLVISEEYQLNSLADILNQRHGGLLHIAKSKPMFLELTEITVNKGVALASLAELYGISREEVMAIGDSYNDIEMIEYAGLGVAMGNARSEVQTKADVITGTNQEEGVAQALERYVLHL
ncbi:MAG: Cof-type HAD-IIB family hydrolase [Desulfitobacteriaceae bacterium]|nr:Cof-type HAD-IIB family hydrolase [Desulfitobacteriaceae bacterium]MDD4345627.1 Cof-type HAD-IIB family hydrolase [Desulfitobacteriaceae bacterium]MDD4400444.1 Cof-type HAD-IIB family hydrolase [Desulfitobacteriaceae bacterium]